MATNRWLGIQQETAQSGSFNVTADDVTTSYKITIGGVTITTLGSGVSTTATATAIAAALAASKQGMFAEITWTSSTTKVIGTASTAGQPFTATSAVSGGAGTIGSYVAITANTSSHDLNDATNWSLAATPANGDDVYFDASSNVPVYWNLGALSAITPNSVNFEGIFTSQVALKSTNSFGTPYAEYRATELAFDAQVGGSKINIGRGPGQGSGLIKLNLGSTGVWTINQYTTGSAIEQNRKAVTFRGPSTNTVLNILGGTFDVCAEHSSDTATVATANIGTASAAPTVRFAPGAALTTLNNDNGTVELDVAATTINHKSGSLLIIGTGAITTLSAQGGTVLDVGTGTITTLNIASGATFNLGDQGAAITVTNTVQVYKGATYLDRGFRSTPTFKLNQCRVSDFTYDVGPNRTIAVT